MARKVHNLSQFVLPARKLLKKAAKVSAYLMQRPSLCLACQKSPDRTFLTASTAERFELFKTLLRPKRLKNQAFWRRIIVTRELRFAAACGRRKRCAISAAAPSAGRRETGPQMALRQGEQGALVSLRLGHAAALTCHRHVIHYRSAASLPLALPRGSVVED